MTKSKKERSFPLVDAICSRRLKNGCRIYLCPMPSARTVSCQVQVATGSAYEGADLGCGLSHFLEHMMFSGTKSFPGRNEISDRVNALGGGLNAYTSSDVTLYYINLPSAHACDGVRMLTSMMREPLFPEDEFAREKDVIVNESGMRHDQPRTLVYETMIGELFRGSPFRVPVIGYEHLLKGVTREQMVNYYRRRYTPDRMNFIIAGAFDPDAVYSELETALNDWESASFVEEALPAPNNISGVRSLDLEFDDALCYLAFGWQIPEIDAKTKAALQTIAFLFDDDSGRLSQELCVKTRLAARTCADFKMFPDKTGFFIAMLEGSPAQCGGICDGFRRVLADLHKHPVTNQELNRSRVSVEAELLYLFDRPDRFAGLIANIVHNTGGTDVAAVLRSLEELTPDDVADALHRLLPQDDFQCVRMRPAEKKKSAGVKHVKQPSMPQLPIVSKARSGQTMLLLADPGRMLAEITLVLPGAAAFEAPGETHLSKLAAETLLSGSANLSEKEFSEKLSDDAIFASTQAGNNAAIISFQFPAAAFDRAVPLFAGMIGEPHFESSAVEYERNNLLEEIENQLKNPESLAVSTLKTRLFGTDHPYGRTPEDAMRSIRTATPETVRNYYLSRILSAPGACLAFSGNLTLRQAQDAASRIFGAGKWAKKAPCRPAPPPMLQPDDFNISRGGRIQSVVLCGFRSPGVNNPHDIEWDLAGAAENGMSSHIFKTVRGENGLAYSAGFFRMSGFGAGASAFYASTSKESVKQVRALLLDEYRRLASKGLDKDEFDAALASCKFAFDTLLPGDLATQAALEQYLLGNPLSPWQDREMLDMVSRASANRVLKHALKDIQPTVVSIISEGADK